MFRRPDEDHDVVVHYMRLPVAHGGAGKDVWTVWLGREQLGYRHTLEAATALAGQVAAMNSRPAWLLDETGYPLKPIERTGRES